MKNHRRKKVVWRYGSITVFDQDEFIGRSIEMYGEWAQNEIEFLRTFLESEWCQNIVIAGANIGVQTIAFSKYLNSSGEIYCFEVHPDLYPILKENVEGASLENVRLFHLGLWKEKGEVQVERFPSGRILNFGGYSITQPQPSAEDSAPDVRNVGLVALDDLSISKCDLIFLDVEGGELNVLKGATQLIDRARPCIYGEARNLEEAVPLYGFLKSLGYELFLHNPLAFNPYNYKGNPYNIFGPKREVALWAVPNEKLDKLPVELRSHSHLHAVRTYADLAKGFAELPYFDCQLYWGINKDSFSEESSAKEFLSIDSDKHAIQFVLSNEGPISCLRFDIANRPGLVKIEQIRVVDKQNSEGRTILNLDSAGKINAFCEKSGVEFFNQEGNGIFLILSDSAHFVFYLPEILKSELIEVEVLLHWPRSYRKFYKTQQGIVSGLHQEIEQYLIPQKELILELSGQQQEEQGVLKEQLKSIEDRLDNTLLQLIEVATQQNDWKDDMESVHSLFLQELEKQIEVIRGRLSEFSAEQSLTRDRQLKIFEYHDRLADNLEEIVARQAEFFDAAAKQIEEANTSILSQASALEIRLNERFSEQSHQMSAIQNLLKPKRKSNFRFSSMKDIKAFAVNSIPILSTLIKKITQRKHLALLKQSPLFDPLYYLEQYPDVAKLKMDPARHYLLHGGFEGRNPSPAFDSDSYLQRYEDIRRAKWNPLLHYIKYGEQERRIIRPAATTANSQTQSPRDIDPAEGMLMLTSDVEGEVLVSKKTSSAKREIGYTERADAFQESFDPGQPGFQLLASTISESLENKKFVIAFSHDNYLKSVGGIQLYLQDEQNALKSQGISYIQFFPTINRPYELYPYAENFLMTIQVDGIEMGSYKAVDVVWAISQIQKLGYECVSLHLHHFMSWNIKVVEHFLQKYADARKRFFLHDYFTVCPQYNLLFNNKKFCGAPPMDSNACMICQHGADRKIYYPLFLELFRQYNVEVISPSEFALKTWLESFESKDEVTEVVPHQNLEKLTHQPSQLPSRDASANRVIRIAFLGHESYHKGWETWRRLMKLVHKNKQFRAYHFGSRITGKYPEKFVSVQVNHLDRNAMQKQLIKNQIDIAFLWAIWPETYSYTYFESLAAGCFVITHKDSGNIAQQVKDRNNGIVLSSEEELHELFSSDGKEIRELLHEFRSKNQAFYNLVPNQNKINLSSTDLKI